MVRLWVSRSVGWNFFKTYFNSKMVRLWVCGIKQTTIPLPLFQFQNGTIMRMVISTLRVWVPISIPKWYDYEGDIYANKGGGSLFQFQNGTIMSYAKSNRRYFAFLISIPKWYDYESMSCSSSVSNEIFQFQNGTIMSHQRCRNYCFKIDFNSKMVRLWELFISLLNTSKNISIPKWYDYELTANK